MAAILDAGKLTLSGDVGEDWFGDGFTSGDVAAALAQVEDTSTLTVYLNSGGGIAWEGSAIHALLTRRAGQTDVVVDGVAASAASLIAMAGDTVTMSAGSIMMIHDPSMITTGDVQEHERTLEMLNALGTSYARVYAAKSGKSAEECRAIMKAERWFSPDEAVSDGFADRTTNEVAPAVAAYDYRVYAHAPKDLRAKAQRKNWNAARASVRSGHPEKPENKEVRMTDRERAEAAEAEVARLKAEAQSGKDAEAQAADKQELEELRADKAKRENAEAVMALDAAKDRPKLAKTLADRGTKPEDATAILESAAKEAAEANADPDAEDNAYAERFYANDNAEPAKPTASKAKAGWSNVAKRMSTN